MKKTDLMELPVGQWVLLRTRSHEPRKIARVADSAFWREYTVGYTIYRDQEKTAEKSTHRRINQVTYLGSDGHNHAQWKASGDPDQVFFYNPRQVERAITEADIDKLRVEEDNRLRRQYERAARREEKRTTMLDRLTEMAPQCADENWVRLATDEELSRYVALVEETVGTCALEHHAATGL